jgi:uncharacterized protein YqeY
VSIESDLREKLTQSIKARDMATANCIRMVNTKVMERRTAKGFQGEVNDDLYKDVISAYKKSLEKACTEFEKGGEKGQAQIKELQFEIQFLKQFLPAQMSESDLRAAVKAAIGRVMGHVLKQHKGLVDAEDVKRIVAEELR